MSDRYGDGYSAARRFYERRSQDTTAVTREWERPTDPLGEQGRDAIRHAWPTLATALDRLAEENR